VATSPMRKSPDAIATIYTLELAPESTKKHR
jgi:hypothetical protein